jgi:hypothetical protein
MNKFIFNVFSMQGAAVLDIHGNKILKSVAVFNIELVNKGEVVIKIDEDILLRAGSELIIKVINK